MPPGLQGGHRLLRSGEAGDVPSPQPPGARLGADVDDRRLQLDRYDRSGYVRTGLPQQGEMKRGGPIGPPRLRNSRYASDLDGKAGLVARHVDEVEIPLHLHEHRPVAPVLGSIGPRTDGERMAADAMQRGTVAVALERPP